MGGFPVDHGVRNLIGEVDYTGLTAHGNRQFRSIDILANYGTDTISARDSFCRPFDGDLDEDGQPILDEPAHVFGGGVDLLALADFQQLKTFWGIPMFSIVSLHSFAA